MAHGVKNKRRFSGMLIQAVLAGLFFSGHTISPIMPAEGYAVEDSLLNESSRWLPVWIADQHQGSQSNPESNSEQKEVSSGNQKNSQPQSTSKDNPGEKAIRPFRPTERIPADQAVDFPSDI